MKSFKAFLVTIAVVSASFQMPSMGAATVTASKNYVDMKTKVEVVTNAEVGVAGYTVGTNTNCVFASTNYVDSKLGKIKADLITDGTNTIDASRKVWIVEKSAGWSFAGGLPGETYEVSGPTGSFPVYEWTLTGSLGTSATAYNSETNATDINFTTSFGVVQATWSDGAISTNYVGRLALTNDIPPAVTVVAPSTNATAGTAADAKATGTALYTGFTDWEFSGDNPYEYDYKNLWVGIIPDGGSFIYVLYDSGQMVSAVTRQTSDEISVSYDYVGITATRHLVTPTKTSQLVNDGTNGAPFVTSSELEKKRDVTDLSIRTVPTDSNGAEFMVNGVLSGPYDPDGVVGWAPSGGGWVVLWQSAGHYTLNAGGGYADFTISQSNGYANNVSINGTAYHIVGVSTNSIATTAQLPQNYDIVSNRAMSSIGTNALANKPTYDFSRNYDIIKATADIIQLLGGTVTNNPTANGGN